MRKIIHHLRRQSEQTRTHVLHVSTITAGLILILLWIYSLGANFSNKDTQAKINNDLKPLTALKDNLIGGYKSLSEQQ